MAVHHARDAQGPGQHRGGDGLGLAGCGLVAVAGAWALRDLHAGVFWWVAVLGAVAAVAVGVRGRAARRPRGVTLLVGNSPESAVLSGLLQAGRARRNRTDAAGAAVERVRDWDAARARAAETAVAAIVAPEVAGCAAITDAEGRRIPCYSEFHLIERLLGRVPVDLVRDPSWFARLQDRDRFASGYVVCKRLLDLGLALVVGLLTLPLTAGIALALYLDAGRPVFLAAPCVGRGGNIFRLRLFRTVECDDAHDPTLLRRRPARGWKRLIRDAHLDVLPALTNIVAGELSFIGPRPETLAVVNERARGLPLFGKRHLVKPGLASLAQVRFRYTDAARDTRLALEYDLFYIRHAGLALDARIFVRALCLGLRDVAAEAARSARWLLRRARRRLAAIAPFGTARPGAIASIALPRGHAASDAIKACLLVGAGEGGRLIARELRANPGWELWPVGYVDDDLGKVGARIDGLPVFGTTQAIPAIVRREHVDTVVIAIPSASERAVSRIAELARQTSAQILSMPDIGQALRGKNGALTLHSVRVTDVLGRPVVALDVERCRAFIGGRRVLVTGAAGSIGSEVVRQVAKLGPAQLLGLDLNESDLFDLQQELTGSFPAVAFRPVVASITNRTRIDAIFRAFAPEIVFHAAAYKHVPMMEDYPQEAVLSNTIGTYELARAAADHGVARFVLVSSDKAVRPSSVMGASKRLAELALRAVADETGLSACSVRFGNVLGSRGSVIPIFEKQIAAGGPITITDPRMKRYFMTIPEAAGLIVQAGAFGDRNVIYMLDMGEPVAIKDLAERLIRLHGLRVGKDIAIVYSGLRPGEKLHEELSLDFEAAGLTPHGKIRILAEGPRAPSRPGSIAETMARLAAAAETEDPAAVRAGVMELVMQADGVELRYLHDGQHRPYRPTAEQGLAVPDLALQAG